MQVKCSIGAVIEDTKGRRFTCHSFGKAWIDGEYTDVYGWKQFNTDQVPVTFRTSLAQYIDGISRKKIFRLN